MPVSYKNRLIAIRAMLNDSSPEVVREGYESLFKLWLEYTDTPTFHQDIVPLAIEHGNLIHELENRLNEIFLNETIVEPITNRFLREKFEAFASRVSEEVSKHPPVNPIVPPIPEPQITRTPWWKNVFLAIAVSIITLVGIINMSYVLPKKDHSIPADLIGAKLGFIAPTYVSLFDENTIEISIEPSEKTEFEGTITLIFDDPNLVKPVPGQKLSAEFDAHSQVVECEQIKFLLVKMPTHPSLIYHLEISRTDTTNTKCKDGCKTGNESFLIAPLPYIRTTLNWLLGILVALIAALVGNQIKNLVTGLASAVIKKG